ncbi:M35 family metallo-endopeptidase [Agrobacterium radiobacter]|uniref:M35 family metallo-endopeptidase n=1 Tax=Agrobacterium radiobacter TaxID=362 RepID=UPI003CE4E2F1
MLSIHFHKSCTILALGIMLAVAGQAHATNLKYDANCTKEHRTSTNKAFARITPIAKKAAKAVHDMTVEKTSPLYETWFGEVNPTRLARVQSTIGGVRDLLQKKETFTVECVPQRCGNGTFALTAHKKDYIGLCAAFFKAPLTGEDSRSGTLLHELTHVVAGTQDYTYGRTNAQKRAAGNPNEAVNNADNYEFFMEDLSAK